MYNKTLSYFIWKRLIHSPKALHYQVWARKILATGHSIQVSQWVAGTCSLRKLVLIVELVLEPRHLWIWDADLPDNVFTPLSTAHPIHFTQAHKRGSRSPLPHTERSYILRTSSYSFSSNLHSLLFPCPQNNQCSYIFHCRLLLFFLGLRVIKIIYCLSFL